MQRARTLLAREGIRAHMSVAGAEGDILAVRAAPELWLVLARLAPGVRSLGFRYLTLEMNAEAPINSGNQ